MLYPICLQLLAMIGEDNWRQQQGLRQKKGRRKKKAEKWKQEKNKTIYKE